MCLFYFNFISINPESIIQSFKSHQDYLLQLKFNLEYRFLKSMLSFLLPENVLDEFMKEEYIDKFNKGEEFESDEGFKEHLVKKGKQIEDYYIDDDEFDGGEFNSKELIFKIAEQHPRIELNMTMNKSLSTQPLKGFKNKKFSQVVKKKGTKDIVLPGELEPRIYEEGEEIEGARGEDEEEVKCNQYHIKKIISDYNKFGTESATLKYISDYPKEVIEHCKKVGAILDTSKGKKKIEEIEEEYFIIR